MHKGYLAMPAIAAAAVMLLAGANAELLWHYRNLGKAYYENPATQMQAPGELKKALDLEPESVRDRINYGLALLRAGNTQEGIAELERAQKQDRTIPHTWFNLGIAYKKDGQFERAAAEFAQMVRLEPQEPVSHYNLGVLYKLEGKTAEALGEFETAARLNPNLAGPHFQLYNAYRQAGRAADAARELRDFQEIKKRSEGAAVPEDMEWSYYAEIYDARDAAPYTPPPANPAPPRVDLPDLKDVVSMARGDFDNDGLADLCVITKSGAFLYHNDNGKFRRMPTALPAGRYTKAVWLDYDHDYDLDLFLLGEDSRLIRNNGVAGFSDETASFPFVKGRAVDAAPIGVIADTNGFDLAVSYQDRAGVLYRDRLAGKYEAEPLDLLPANSTGLIAYDANHDGWTDLLAGPLLLVNRHGRFERAAAAPAQATSAGSSNWLRVTLAGVKNLKLAYNAKVEVKAGTYYEKQTYFGEPLRFTLGSHREADTVRITWPNGLIQNETKQPVNRAVTYKEQPRLAGSCPMIFTWNGRRFEFITDVLGVAPLGASSGDGKYFPVDHDEYVQIPGAALAPVNGRYEIRIAEELHEVSYLDQVRLVALDHPAAVEIFTNDKFKAPPFPEFRLFGARRRIYPVRREFDGGGRLDLDFGHVAPGNRAVLLLRGWTDWPDGSMFRNAAQQHRELALPYLQVKDAAGQWRTVVEDMGIPSGKSKTIAVDLTGKFLSPAREIRIATNLSVHWDEIFLSEDSGPPPVRMTGVDAESADLHFRGFSKYTNPVTFDYTPAAPVSMWNPTPGQYTRYGDVRELVLAADDRMVIMGSGDELRLTFPAADLPALERGWRRDFLLLVDGWAKDGDANTAFSRSVEPLPFHGMSQYPYKNGEHFPNDEGHRDYIARYNSRPAARLLRSLVHGGAE